MLLLKYSSILLLLFTSQSRGHVSTPAKGHYYYFYEEYNWLGTPKMSLLSPKKPTWPYSRVCGKVWIDFKAFIKFTLYCRVVSN